jgi:hypothetical protein
LSSIKNSIKTKISNRTSINLPAIDHDNERWYMCERNSIQTNKWTCKVQTYKNWDKSNQNNSLLINVPNIIPRFFDKWYLGKQIDSNSVVNIKND